MKADENILKIGKAYTNKQSLYGLLATYKPILRRNNWDKLVLKNTNINFYYYKDFLRPHAILSRKIVYNILSPQYPLKQEIIVIGNVEETCFCLLDKETIKIIQKFDELDYNFLTSISIN